MPRPNKPYWNDARQQWRLRVRGRDHWLPRDEFGPRDKAKAWVRLHAMLQPGVTPAAAAARPTAEKSPTLGDLRQAYLRWADAEASRPGGVMGRRRYANSRSTLRRFVDWAGADREASGLSACDLDRFVAYCIAEGLAAHYIRSLCSAVQAMYNWAARAEIAGQSGSILACNPLIGHRLPPAPASPDRYLDRRVARRFLRWAWARARSTDRCAEKVNFSRSSNRPEQRTIEPDAASAERGR
jgi:hypothetical protein